MRVNKSSIVSRLVFVCGALAVWQPCHARPYSWQTAAAIKLVDDDSGQDDPKQIERDISEALDNGYVYYLSQIKGFDPHIYSVAQVKREAGEYADKLDALLKVNPQYRNQKIGAMVRDESVQMTADELLDKLRHAAQIIQGDQVSAQAQNMSYFVQGDVDDWKNRTARLDANDGFILLASHEYPLLFNRSVGEKHLLAGYSKGNGGKPLPAAVITPLHNQISQLLAKMKALAPSHSFSGGSKAVEPFIAGFIARQAPYNIAGAKVVKTAWLNHPWIIDRNPLGIPVLRRRLGTVLYRVPNQKFYIEQHFFYHEAYAGGGRYARGADVNFADLRFVKS